MKNIMVICKKTWQSCWVRLEFILQNATSILTNKPYVHHEVTNILGKILYGELQNLTSFLSNRIKIMSNTIEKNVIKDFEIIRDATLEIIADANICDHTNFYLSSDVYHHIQQIYDKVKIFLQKVQ